MLPEQTELIDDVNQELLTNRRLSHYNCGDRVLMPIYESIITSPFTEMAIHSLLHILKDNSWSVYKAKGKVNNNKEYIVGKYQSLFWLTVEIKNNTPDNIASWLICPDKTPLIITLTILKPVGDYQKHYTGLVYWDPVDSTPITTIIKKKIQQVLSSGIV